MYRHNQKQLEFEAFNLPFGGRLLGSNRWVSLSKLIPWEDVEHLYASRFADTGMGAPAFSVRMALGALIIKERLGTSDEETVEQIRENPYLQYFLGFREYRFEPPFHPTLFVHFRKRFPEEILKQINERMVERAIASGKQNKEDDNDPDGFSDSGASENRGKLILDATCAPADIAYPTDLKLLNKAREKSEEIMDALHQSMPSWTRKPRNYRQSARKAYLAVSKKRRPSRKVVRKAIRKQLGYLKRNLGGIRKQAQAVSLSNLTRGQHKNLFVIHEVYRQQKWMYDHQVKRIDHRIVSISQPHVRPIKRGKAGADTEFGAKISASLVEGYVFPECISWDNFNESVDLVDLAEVYQTRFGCYPASIHADKIYRTRANIKFCRKNGIRLSGPPLGRPPKQTQEEAAAARKLARQDERDRIAIEGKFGQGKRRFSLNRVMTKLPCTSESSIVLTFIVMNLERWLKSVLFCFFPSWLFRGLAPTGGCGKRLELILNSE